MELLGSLVAQLRAVCATFPDTRKGRGGNIAVADFGLSAFALFFMQSASFLAFQRALEKGQGRSNCESLFGIGTIPSDNYIRDMLDGVDPALLQPCFERMEQLLAAPPLRASFARLDDRILIAWDGTEYFCSQKLGCPHCLTRKRANGKVESYHTLLAATAVAPGHAKVVALFPEFIAPQDGAEKQDCERNAAKRWHSSHADRLRPLRPVYLGDDLFACQPIVTMLADAGDDFIFTCKETSHKALYDFIDGAEPERHVETIRKGKAVETRRYRWITAVPLRDGKDAAPVAPHRTYVVCRLAHRLGATAVPKSASAAPIVQCGTVVSAMISGLRFARAKPYHAGRIAAEHSRAAMAGGPHPSSNPGLRVTTTGVCTARRATDPSSLRFTNRA